MFRRTFDEKERDASSPRTAFVVFSTYPPRGGFRASNSRNLASSRRFSASATSDRRLALTSLSRDEEENAFERSALCSGSGLPPLLTKSADTNKNASTLRRHRSRLASRRVACATSDSTESSRAKRAKFVHTSLVSERKLSALQDSSSRGASHDAVLQRGGEQRGDGSADEKKEDVRNPSAARTPSHERLTLAGESRATNRSNDDDSERLGRVGGDRSGIGTSAACEDGGGDRGDARCDICATCTRRTPVSVTRVGLGRAAVSERHYEVGALLRRSV